MQRKPKYSNIYSRFLKPLRYPYRTLLEDELDCKEKYTRYHLCNFCFWRAIITGDLQAT